MKVINNSGYPLGYAKEGDAGIDLRSMGNCIINPRNTRTIGTGVKVEIPEGHVGLLFARSGLSIKYGVAPANKVGVIDSGFRGEIMVGLHNHGTTPVQIAKGDRIAQLVIIPFATPEIKVVEELSETERGEGGLGSTGKK